MIGWQDVRTAEWCRDRTGPGDDELVRGRTGLRIDAMFSAPKIGWLLRESAAGAASGDVCVGTVDSWLVWRLTAGERHVTEAGNASRTLLYDIVDLAWSPALLELFDVPAAVLPEVLRSDGDFGVCRSVPGLPDGVPITAVLADSHAALFGHGCTEVGTAKATYGTGTSVMTPTAVVRGRLLPRPVHAGLAHRDPDVRPRGQHPVVRGDPGLGGPAAGSASVPDLLALAATVEDAGAVTLVPAFTGLGAPHWDREVRGVLTQLDPDSDPARVARAAVDAVAHQVCDIVEIIDDESTAPAGEHPRRRRHDRLGPGDADPGRSARSPGGGGRPARGVRARRRRPGPPPDRRCADPAVDRTGVRARRSTTAPAPIAGTAGGSRCAGSARHRDAEPRRARSRRDG